MKHSVTLSVWNELANKIQIRLDLCFQVADTMLVFRVWGLEVIEKSVIGKGMSLTGDLNRFDQLKTLVAKNLRLNRSRIAHCVSIKEHDGGRVPIDFGKSATKRYYWELAC